MKKQTLIIALTLAVSAGFAIAQGPGDRPPGPPPGPPPGGGPGPGGGEPGRRPPAPPIIAALDTDGDGVISVEEITNAAAALKKLDKNGDGKLTPDEFLPNPPQGGPGGPGQPRPPQGGPKDGGPRGQFAPPPGGPPPSGDGAFRPSQREPLASAEDQGRRQQPQRDVPRGGGPGLPERRPDAGLGRFLGGAESLTPDEREKVRAAQGKAMQDKNVQIAEAGMRDAMKALHTAQDAAMLAADPSIEPILAKLKEAREKAVEGMRRRGEGEQAKRGEADRPGGPPRRPPGDN